MKNMIAECGRAILLTALVCSWGILAAANFISGTEFAHGSGWGWLFGAASVASDALKAAMPIAIYAAWRSRNVLAGFLAVVILVMTLGWSVRSGLNFIGSTFANSNEERSSVALSYSVAKSNVEAERDNLRALLSTTVQGRRERISLRNDIADQRLALKEAIAEFKKTPPVGSVDMFTKAVRYVWPDASDTDAVFTTAVVFLFVLELCAMGGFAATAPLLVGTKPRKTPAEEIADAMRTTVMDLRELNRPQAEPEPPAPPPIIPSAAVQPPPVLTVVTEENEVKPPAKKVQPQRGAAAADVVAQRSSEFAGFVDNLIDTHGAGARVVTTDVQDQYASYCGRKGISAIDACNLGRQLSRHGVVRNERKDAQGKRVYILPKREGSA